MNENEKYLKLLIKAWGIECNDYQITYMICYPELLHTIRKIRNKILEIKQYTDTKDLSFLDKEKK